jgi:PAS domain S-box-containing protein
MDFDECYRLATEHSNEGVIIVSGDKRLFINQRCLELAGYHTAQELDKKPFLSTVHPDDREKVRKIISKRQSGKPAPSLYEFRFLRQDGSIIYVEISSCSITYMGQPASLGYLRDISNHKQIEEKLRQSEERYRNILESIREGYFELDLDGNYTFANEANCRYLGYTKEELIGMNYRQHTDEETAKKLYQPYYELYQTGKPIELLDLESIRKDGTKAIYETSVSLIRDNKGNPIGFRGVSRDITARKKMEEALRQSEEKHRQILENMEEGYFEMDLVGNFTFVNNAECRNLGYSKEELIGMNNRRFQDETTARRLYQIFNNVYKTGDPVEIIDIEIIKKDGTKKFNEISVSLIRDSKGEKIGFSGVTRDITERKLAEEEKRKLEERLQSAHKMEAIGTLAGGIAHDFNNLLMGIQGYASLALLNINQNDPNYEKLKRIEQQVQSGADLTRQLLGFARGGRYEVKPADINDIIQKASSMFGRTKKEITIHMKYEKNLCPVEVDLGQMEQVFMNLYVNAWQAMPGGGNIYLETENVFLNDKQALHSSVKPGKYVKITVTDTGTGMDEKTRQRIFDPFFTTKEMGRGTGLGLATVYGIIKGHKGMINVYSELGHGTTFTIYLPASEKEVVKKETATGTIDRGTETILLVDDEKIVLEANRGMLESMGYRVYAVESGQEAITLFKGKRNEIDLVILDMIMPEISGGETFDRLREINPGIKVLLSSGYSLNGEAQTIMDRGCKGFIQKPFRIEKLSQKVREMLN